MNNNINNTVVIVKMSAKSQRNNHYASILIYINKSLCDLFDMKTHVSKDPKFAENTLVSKNWNIIEGAIEVEKLMGSQDVAISLNEKVSNLLNIQNIELLLLFANNNSIRSVVGLFDKSINAIFDDAKTVYSVSFEVSTVETIELQRKNLKPGDVEESNIEIIPEEPNLNNIEEQIDGIDNNLEYSIIKATLVMAPVNGIPIGQVKIGDKVLTKISNESPTESRVIRELKPTELDGYQFIVPAEIINISIIKTGGMLLVLKFIDGVYAKVEELQPVKLSIMQDKKFKFGNNISSMLVKLIIIGSFWVVLLIVLSIYFYK